MLESIVASTPIKRKRKAYPGGALPGCRKVSSFYRQVTCTYNYGEATEDGVKPALSTRQLLWRWASQVEDKGRGFGRYWSVKKSDLEAHVSSKKTLYFWASESPLLRYALVMLDIDVKKAKGKGSVEAGRKLAEHLKMLFPGSYWEPSTGGQGMHGYLLIDKDGYTSSNVKKGMQNLAAFLRREAEGYDIEQIELKGAPPVVTWAGSSMEEITFGTFAKLPRQANIDDLQGLHVIPLDKLLRDETFTAPAKAEAKAPKTGSCTFNLGDAKALHRLACFAASEGLCGMRVGKGVVTAEDTATALMVMQWMKEHPNPDKQAPTAMAEWLWGYLYETGVTMRCWDGRKWKAVRTLLGEKGLLDVIDSTYWFYADGSAKGKAMQWEVTDAFAAVLRGLLSPSPEAGGDIYREQVKKAYLLCLGEGPPLVPQGIIRGVFDANDPDILQKKYGEMDWWAAVAA